MRLPITGVSWVREILFRTVDVLYHIQGAELIERSFVQRYYRFGYYGIKLTSRVGLTRSRLWITGSGVVEKKVGGGEGARRTPLAYRLLSGGSCIGSQGQRDSDVRLVIFIYLRDLIFFCFRFDKSLQRITENHLHYNSIVY